MRDSMPHRPVAALALSVLLATVSSAAADPARSVDRSPAKPYTPRSVPSKAALDETFGRLPLQFEENRGQVDPRVRYLTRGRGSTLFLTDDEAVWVLSRGEKAPASDAQRLLERREPNRDPGDRVSSVVRMRLEGSEPKPRLNGLDRLPGNVNYFIGNDPKKWRTDVPTYRQVKVEDVYAGIDLLYYGNQRQLEYDFVVKPGADPSVIRIAFTGADRIATDASGELVIATAAGELRMKSPLVYQVRDGQRELVAAAYIVRPGEKAVEFRLADYDRSRSLVIDPVIVWSTYVGPLYGSLFGSAVPSGGGLLLAGWARHAGFPTTPGTIFPTDTSTQDFRTGVVLRLNSAGTALDYSTYLGGPIDNWFVDVASDAGGAAYVTGWTQHSVGYPTTPGGDIVPGSTIVVSKISAQGNSLLYSARIGGTNQSSSYGIDVDSQGQAYVCGQLVQGTMPIPPGAFQGLSAVSSYGSGFAAKVNAGGTSLVWATILGGVLKTDPTQTYVSSIATDIKADGAGGAFVVGGTDAAEFPTTPGAFQPTHVDVPGTDRDIFVVRLNSTATGAVYSTFLGPGNDQVRVDADTSGSAYVTGPSRYPFPITPGAYANCCGPVFVSKLAPDGSSLVYSTYLGMNGGGIVRDIVVDSSGQAIIAGYLGIGAPDFPVTPPNDPGLSGGVYYVFRLDAAGSTMSYGSRFGPTSSDTDIFEGPTSLALGPGTDLFVTGSTRSTVFPTTPGSFQPSDPDPTVGLPQPSDGFVIRLRLPLPVSATGIVPATGPSLGGTPVTITGTGFQTGALVRLGGIPATVSTLTATSISAVTGPHPDGLVDVEVENPDGGVAVLKNAFTYVCGGTAPTAALTGGGTICAGQGTTLSVALTGTGPWSLVWSDGVAQNGLATSPATRVVTPLSTTTYNVRTVTDTVCAGASSGSAVVTVNPVPATTLSVPARLCAGQTGTASIPATSGATYAWTVTNGSLLSGQGTPAITFSGASPSATVSVVATLGSCSSSASRDVPVSVAPSATVSGGGTICSGGSATVSFVLSGSPPFTVVWSDGVSQPVAAAGPGSRTVSPTATRSYSMVTLSDATGCPGGSSTGSATVTVNPLPSAAITAPGAYCTGATGLVASVPDAGAGATYAWTIAGGAFVGGTAGSSVTFNPSGASVTLGVTVTLPTTCSASSTRVLTLSPPPSAIVSGGGTICSDTDAAVNVALSGTPPFSLTWSDGFVQSGISSATTQRIVRPASATTYSVTSVRDAACTGSASGSATFNVVASPSAVVTSPATTICPGGSATIAVQLGGPGPYTLIWSDGLVENMSGSETFRNVSPSMTTIYGISSVSNGTCSVPGAGSTTVVVFPDASAVAIAGPLEACEEAAGLAAAVPDSGPGTTYTWTVANGAIVSGQGTRSIVWTGGKAGEAILGVTVRVAAGCEIAGTVRVRLNARPPMPVLSAPAVVESGARGVVAEVVGGAGPAWDWTITNATITSGAGTSRVTFDVGDPGLVLVDVVEKNAKGCGSPAAHAEVLVKGLTFTRLAPIVLDVAGPGGPRYTTELALSNPSPSTVRVDVVYTAATSLGASGSGKTTETLAAGRQAVIPDVLAWLRGKGLAIPVDGSPQGGTLRVTFDGVAAGWTPSATTRTTVPSGSGRAGLSMPAIDPAAASASKIWLFGLRENAADRSNVALVHAGLDGSLDLKVTLYSGAGNSVPRYVLPDVRLEAGQWLQLNSVLRVAGFATGYALVERVGGTAPFHAYAVFNDNETNDGSVVAATPAGRLASAAVVPVVVETGSFASELVLANPGPTASKARLWFTESLANPGGYSMGGVTIDLAPGEQKIIPAIVSELRRLGLEIVPANRDYAGTLVATFSVGGEAAEGWAGARTATAGTGAGRYGLFGPAQVPKASAKEVWLFGLLQNAETRSNLALLNGAANLGSVTLRYTVFDGVTGKKAATSEPVTLGPGAWIQMNGFLSKWQIANGYVRVERVDGSAPFVAYAVVNDGGVPGKGTGDGSFVEMSTTTP